MRRILPAILLLCAFVGVAGACSPPAINRRGVAAPVTSPAGRSPAVRIEPLGVAKREGDGWRTTWRITNAEPDAVRVVDAVAPHSQFRGEVSLDREIRAKGSTQFSLVVRVDGTAGSEIENAFVIVRIQQGDERWRFLARLRVPLDEAARPVPHVEAITVQRVGFSGEL